MTDPSEQVTMWKAGAIGKNSDKVIGLLENSYKDGLSEDEALNVTIGAILNYVEAGSKNMEVAVMRPGREIEIVPDEKVDQIINQHEEKKKSEEKK